LCGGRIDPVFGFSQDSDHELFTDGLFGAPVLSHALLATTFNEVMKPKRRASIIAQMLMLPFCVFNGK
jgi:hypothetical protein